MVNGFGLLHPDVQRRLWEMRWTSLRPIQDKVIGHVMGDGGDCVVAVPTAGGKTEAAFLPILSRIAEDAFQGVRVMYVGPLKALINDQFRRLEDLCLRMDVPIHKWHGDVGDVRRRMVLEQPGGVLLITPESIEAMFVLRASRMPGLFSKLQYVVIDELHAFIGSARGAQLQSQLSRLHERCGCDPIRVGLSATLGDPNAACAWLRPNGKPATYLTDDSAIRTVKVKVSGLWKEHEAEPEANEQDAETQIDDTVGRTIARQVLRACGSKTNLAFANAKSRIEEFADALKLEADAMSMRHDVVVHHGSLSKEQREFAEERIRGEAPCTAVCSNTLEMGIDIGQVDTVIQVTAPWSVASLTQRVGRSGRRDGSDAVLRAYFVEDAPHVTDTVWERLHLGFLRGVAMVALMLEEYTEPVDARRPHLSTLVQQLMSSIAECGGISAQKLYRRLMASGAFAKLSPHDFELLLRWLATKKLVEQMAQGDLVLGETGEKFCDHAGFFAAFASPDEFRVCHGSMEIGSLPATLLPPPGDHVLLGGRRWMVEFIDSARREVAVVPAHGRKKPLFSSMPLDVHPRVHEAMRVIACGTAMPNYLDSTACEILEQIRVTATSLNNFGPQLQSAGESKRTRLFLWAGSKVQRTVWLCLREAGLEVEDEEIGFEIMAPYEEVKHVLEQLVLNSPRGDSLAARAEEELAARARSSDKFDWAIPSPLWRRAYAEDHLDLAGAARVIEAASK